MFYPMRKGRRNYPGGKNVRGGNMSTGKCPNPAVRDTARNLHRNWNTSLFTSLEVIRAIWGGVANKKTISDRETDRSTDQQTDSQRDAVKTLPEPGNVWTVRVERPSSVFSPQNSLTFTVQKQCHIEQYEVGTLDVDGWAVTCGKAMRGLGGAPSQPRPLLAVPNVTVRPSTVCVWCTNHRIAV